MKRIMWRGNIRGGAVWGNGPPSKKGHRLLHPASRVSLSSTHFRANRSVGVPLARLRASSLRFDDDESLMRSVFRSRARNRLTGSGYSSGERICASPRSSFVNVPLRLRSRMYASSALVVFFGLCFITPFVFEIAFDHFPAFDQYGRFGESWFRAIVPHAQQPGDILPPGFVRETHSQTAFRGGFEKSGAARAA